MATYSDVARMLARLEQRVAAVDPEPPVAVWLRVRDAGTVTNSRTGEVLAGDEFDRRYPAAHGFTLDLAPAPAEWEPPVVGWGAYDAQEEGR